MLQITGNAHRLFSTHGWSDDDISYLLENADDIEMTEAWAIGVAVAPDGVVWLYPVAGVNDFPLSLWKRIKWYIQNNDNVVIPMNKNMDKVANAAKAYNGFLSDNYYMFGEELQGLKLHEGGKRWHS